MRTHNKHPQWYNIPMRLNDAQKENPVLVLDDFFECYHLNEVRETMWNWLVEVISSPHGISHDHHERNNQFYFYEKIEALIEAAYVMRKKIHRHLRKSRKKKR